jgi:hypothetical protein
MTVLIEPDEPVIEPPLAKSNPLMANWPMSPLYK